MALTKNPLFRRATPLLWIVWLMVSVGPLLVYASPLWNNILADTPIADLIWIPIIAFGWMAWNIRLSNGDAPDDSELNFILGGILAVMTALVLVLAPERWPAFFVYNHGGLLLWPLWILAMVWLFWGFARTRHVVLPLFYLLLVWPPIFSAIADATQTVLVNWAVGVLTELARQVTWLRTSTPTGTFSVLYHHQPYLVEVAQACSGADSLLGSAILIPALWFIFKGRIRAKLWLSLFALVGSLVLNWVRLAIIVLAVHIIGPHITFAYIHPVMGFFLFAVLVVGLMVLLRPFGLDIPRRTPSSNAQPILPGWTRIGTAVITAGLSLALLWPLFSLPRGSFGNPSVVKAYNVHTFLPALTAFNQSPVYYANESSILGPGSATQADLYTSSSASGQTMVEMWSTPDASSLATYGFQACLLYHGDQIKAVTSFQLEPGVLATAYAVNLPPAHVGGKRSTYVDIEWNAAISVHGHIQYMRWSIASFPQSAPVQTVSATNVSLENLTPIQAMVAPPRSGAWNNSDLKTRTVLVTMAQQLFLAASHPNVIS